MKRILLCIGASLLAVGCGNITASVAEKECGTKTRRSFWGASCVQGTRPGYEVMEDRHTIKKLQSCSGTGSIYHFFGIYDGHGGDDRGGYYDLGNFTKDNPGDFWSCTTDGKGVKKQLRTRDGNFVADLVSTTLHDYLENLLCGSADSLKQNLIKAFWLTDNAVEVYRKKRKENRINDDCGTTAVVSVLHKNMLYVANAGDSRFILCKKGKVGFVSKDHSPKNEAEVERIKKTSYYLSGGMTSSLFNRNSGVQITLFRGIGHQAEDHFPGCCIPMPDVEKIPLTDDIEFAIMVSDGITGRVSDEDSVDCIRNFWKKEPGNLAGAAEALQKLAVEKGGKDDKTVIVIDLQAYLQQHAEDSASSSLSSSSSRSSSSSPASSSSSISTSSSSPSSLSSSLQSVTLE